MNGYVISLHLSEYPSPANPTRAPKLTQIGNGTRYIINITDSIPSDFDRNLGYSTLIVRVQDLSSKTPSDYTYYVLVWHNIIICCLILRGL